VSDARTDEERGRKEERERDDTGDLAARVELLEAENERLREAYAAARRVHNRRVAGGFLLVGLVALAGAVFVPPARTVLLALAGTGLFAALLVVLLTPERFVAAGVGPAVYDAHQATAGAVVDELGLSGERVYLPDDGGRLFVPQYGEYDLPADRAPLFVVADREPERGVALRPTGASLLRDLEPTLSGGLSADAEEIVTQLTDGVVDGFELAAVAAPDRDEGRLAVGVADAAYGPVDRLDHPVASLLGVGLARGLDTPVTVTVEQPDDDRYDWLVVCSW